MEKGVWCKEYIKRNTSTCHDEGQEVVLETAPLLELIVMVGKCEQVVEVMVCPYCNGVLGIDWTFLDQISELIQCPMCTNWSVALVSNDPIRTVDTVMRIAIAPKE